MAKTSPTLGDQELRVLRYVTGQAPITVREVAAAFGAQHNLARTTILTMMERLRKKAFYIAEKDGGAFQYTPAVTETELLQTLVQDFVQKTLGGSLSPFVAYLAASKNLTEAEKSELRRLAARVENECRENERPEEQQ